MLLRQIDEALNEARKTKAEVAADEKLATLLAEWRTVAQKAEVLAAVVKHLTAGQTKIEGEVKALLDEQKVQIKEINGVTVKLNSKPTTGFKHKEFVERAMAIATADQKVVLQKAVAELTSNNTKVSLQVIDPAVADILDEVKGVSADNVLEVIERLGAITELPKKAARLAKKANLSEGVGADIVAALRKLASGLQRFVTGFGKALQRSRKSVNALLKAANGQGAKDSAEAVTESADEADSVIARLKRFAQANADGHEISDADVTRLHGIIKDKLKEGWTTDEAFRHFRWTEEVNPKAEEGHACRMMKQVADAAKKRLSVKEDLAGQVLDGDDDEVAVVLHGFPVAGVNEDRIRGRLNSAYPAISVVEVVLNGGGDRAELTVSGNKHDVDEFLHDYGYKETGAYDYVDAAVTEERAGVKSLADFMHR